MGGEAAPHTMNRQFLKDGVKLGLGAACAFCFRGKANRIRQQFTLSQGRRPLIERLIHFYLASQKGSLEQSHRAFWGKADWYFGTVSSRLDEVYIPTYGELVRSLAPMLVERHIQAVCEWGTGDGRWLDHLSRQWTSVPRFVGIDISQHQIARNREALPQLQFVAADVVEWTEQAAAPRSLFHSNNGVLEYLAEASVRRLYAAVARRAPGSLVLVIEPLYGDYDPQVETASRVVGNEHSFCHPHAHLLVSSGFTLLRREERQVAGNRMVIVLAAAPEPGGVPTNRR